MTAKRPDTLLVQDRDGRQTTIPGDTADDVLTARGWSVIEDAQAVSRPRRTRSKGWYAQAIKDGVIADPDKGIPERVPGDNEYVVDVPTAVASGKVEVT